MDQGPKISMDRMNMEDIRRREPAAPSPHRTSHVELKRRNQCKKELTAAFSCPRSRTEFELMQAFAPACRQPLKHRSSLSSARESRTRADAHATLRRSG